MAQAIPGPQGAVGPAGSGGGLLRVVSNSQIDEFQQRQKADASPARTPVQADIGSYIRTLWNEFRNRRNTGPDSLNDRLLRAQRMFEGKYDQSKLAEIQKFGGSQVYSRLVATKCRGASSLLRDVYLGPDRPWDIQPEPDPQVPPEIQTSIIQLVNSEVQALKQGGKPIGADQIHMRILGLTHNAQQAAKRNANMQAATAADKVDDILVSGRFYEAMSLFLIDLPLFPFACLKGPVVRMTNTVSWTGKKPTVKRVPQMFWERVSPFDLYWSPGASNIADADIIERKRLSRSDLNDLIGLPGYDENAIRAAIEDYNHGLREWMDSTDTERALYEQRENPTLNTSGMIDVIEFHGQLRGDMLLTAGVPKRQIPDPELDYAVQSWVVGRHTIKTQINPSPRQRHPYYVTSFEKVPGAVAGHSIPDLLEDIQEIANSSLRSLVNNMSIASGPQVVVDENTLAPGENGDELYPWKRWHVQRDPMDTTTREAITFFQPQSNSQELLGVYTSMNSMADDISAIPRYITGSSSNLGGAGRTASGLSMLMGNAEKILQTVAANIDNDIMELLLMALYEMVMLTDTTNMLSGGEKIRVRGVNVAVQKETERQKQLQFLQITANPIDAPIIGMMGRARVLRAMAQGLGLPDDVVPDDQTLQAQMDAEKQLQAASQSLQAAANEGGPQDPTRQPPAPPGKGGAKPGAAAQAQGAQPPQAAPTQGGDMAPPVNLQQQGMPYNAK